MYQAYTNEPKGARPNAPTFDTHGARERTATERALTNYERTRMNPSRVHTGIERTHPNEPFDRQGADERTKRTQTNPSTHVNRPNAHLGFQKRTRMNPGRTGMDQRTRTNPTNSSEHENRPNVPESPLRPPGCT